MQLGAVAMVAVGMVSQLQALAHVGQPALLKIIFLLIVRGIRRNRDPRHAGNDDVRVLRAARRGAVGGA